MVSATMSNLPTSLFTEDRDSNNDISQGNKDVDYALPALLRTYRDACSTRCLWSTLPCP